MVETLTPFVFPNSVHQSFDPSAPFAFGLAWDRQYPPNLSQVFSQEASLQARRWQVSRGPHQASVAREPTDRHPCCQWPTGERCWLSQGRPTGRQVQSVSSRVCFSVLTNCLWESTWVNRTGASSPVDLPGVSCAGTLHQPPQEWERRGGGLIWVRVILPGCSEFRGPAKGEGASEVFVLQQSSSMFYNRKTNIPTSPGLHSSHPYPALPGPHCSSTSESFPKIFF